MSSEEIINGLNQAKAVLEAQPQTFPQVLQVVIQMGQSNQSLSIQQWISQFLQDWFSLENDKISPLVKQSELGNIIPLLLQFSKIQDVSVYKNVLLTITSIYDILFDLIAKTSNDQLWSDFINLKNFIISNWNSSYPLNSEEPELDKFRSIGSKLASVKFISKLIIVQSLGSTTSSSTLQDPRRRNNGGQLNSNNNNEISISNINENHPVLSKISLDAESQGLLDSLLDYLNNEEFLVSQVFISIIENLVYIVQRRKQFSVKIFTTLSKFDINSKFQYPTDSFLKFKLTKRFTERSLKNALNYLNRAGLINNTNPISSKFQKIVIAINTKQDEQRKKGILKQLSNERPNKKPTTNQPFSNNSMIIDDDSYSSLYQLIDDSDELIEFDVSQIPSQALTNIAIATLHNVDTNKLITALSIISARYADLTNKSTGVITQPVLKDDLEIEVENSLQTDDNDNEKILQNSIENDDNNLETTYTLPLPSKIDKVDKRRHIQSIVKNFIQLSNTKDDSLIVKDEQNLDSFIKISKIAIQNWKKNSWLILLTRLATRGLQNDNNDDDDDDDSIDETDEKYSDLIRESIFNYFLENIHERIDVVLEWLNEEWYSEFIKNSKDEVEIDQDNVETPIYFKWTGKVLDSMIPFLDSNDRKIFIRLLSDLPILNDLLVMRIKSLCIDPQRSVLGFQSLQFLIMFRPPVKSSCIDILKDLYENNEDLKDKALPLLKKYTDEYKDITT